MGQSRWVRESLKHGWRNNSAFHVHRCAKHCVGLTSDRLVEFHPNRGYQAVSYSPHDVAAIYSCRALLESEAVRLIAENGLDTTAAARLSDVNARAEKEFMSDRPKEELRTRFLKLNNEFHGVLYGECPNPILRRLIRTTTEIPMGIRNYFRFSDAQVLASHTAHKNILRAVLSGETERAGALMREHIWTAKDQMIEPNSNRATDTDELPGAALSYLPTQDYDAAGSPDLHTAKLEP